ncbi:MAG: hypothetical protein ABIN58_02265 [candidate division WOR-3 bacterium]
MKRLAKNIGIAALLITLAALVIPVHAQGPVPPISPEAQKEKARLLAEYQKALEHELQYGETVISPEDGKTRILVGRSAEKIAYLWQETVKKIETAVARPASEREPVEKMIEAISGSSPVYLERFTLPYNPSAALERYRAGKFFYTVDIASSQVVDVSPVDVSVFPPHSRESALSKGHYSQIELEERARAYIQSVAGDINLSILQPAFGDKEGRIYFFRWEDPSRSLYDGNAPFVQVAISSLDGEIRHYVNTLPLAMTHSQAVLQKIGVLPRKVRAVFNEVYANGGLYWAWLSNGGSADTTSNAGYCYIAGWCSPKNFYWSWTDATTYPPQNEPYINGKWTTNVTTESTRLYAFIPSQNATAYARYTAKINNGATTVTTVIDQEIYYNVWVFLLGYYPQFTQVTLDNNDDIANYKVAWDEVMLCSLGTCP